MDSEPTPAHVEQLAREVNELFDECAELEELSGKPSKEWDRIGNRLERVWRDKGFEVDYRSAHPILLQIRADLLKLLHQIQEVVNEEPAGEIMDEFVDAKLRQTVTHYAHMLHTNLSEGSETWYESVQTMLKQDVSSQQFFSIIIEYVLKILIRKNIELLQPEVLLEFLQSDEGRSQIEAEIKRLMLKDCEECIEALQEHLKNDPF